MMNLMNHLLNRIATNRRRHARNQTTRIHRWRRPRVERLEDRHLLAAISWDGGGDGTSWNDERNWLPPRVPGPEDDVTVCVAGDVTVHVTGNQVVRTLENCETLVVSGSKAGGHTTFAVTQSLTNRGTIQMTSRDGGYRSDLTSAPDGIIFNEPTARIELMYGTGGNRYITGQLVNRGAIYVDPGVPNVRPGVGVNARFMGTFDAAGGTFEGAALWFEGSTLRMTASPPKEVVFMIVGNDNRIRGDILPNAEVVVNGNNLWEHATLTIDSDVSNYGKIRLESTGRAWSSNLTVAPGSTLTNVSTGVIDINYGSGGTRYLSGHIVNEGTIDVEANVGFSAQVFGEFDAAGGSLTGETLWFVWATLRMTAPQPEGIVFVFVGSDNRICGDILPNAEVLVNGNNLWEHTTLIIDCDVTNHGTIRLESTGKRWSSNLTVAPGVTLTNAFDGIIRADLGSGGPRELKGNIHNKGVVALRSDATIGGQGAQFTNRGIVQIHDVALTLSGGAFTNQIGGLVAGSEAFDTAGAAFINLGTADLTGPCAFDLDVFPTHLELQYYDTFGMAALAVENLQAYRLYGSGGDGSFGDGHDTDLTHLLSSAVFDPNTQTVSLGLSGRLDPDAYLVSIDGDAVTNLNGERLSSGETVLVASELGSRPPNGNVRIDGFAGIYFQDFDEALGSDAGQVGISLPTGWVGHNNFATNTTISESFLDGNVTSGTYNAGSIFGGDTQDRTLAIGNGDSREESALVFYAEITGEDVKGLRLALDVEAWLSGRNADNPGEAAFQVTLDVNDGNGFQTVLEFNEGDAISTGAALEPGLLDGNAPGNRVSLDSAGVAAAIPAGSIIRVQFDAQDQGRTSNWVFGVDNVLLRALRPGDTDGDGCIDQMDIVRILQAGKYLAGPPATWAEGDFDGDQDVDQFDIVAITRELMCGFPICYTPSRSACP